MDFRSNPENRIQQMQKTKDTFSVVNYAPRTLLKSSCSFHATLWIVEYLCLTICGVLHQSIWNRWYPRIEYAKKERMVAMMWWFENSATMLNILITYSYTTNRMLVSRRHKTSKNNNNMVILFEMNTKYKFGFSVKCCWNRGRFQRAQGALYIKMVR